MTSLPAREFTPRNFFNPTQYFARVNSNVPTEVLSPLCALTQDYLRSILPTRFATATWEGATGEDRTELFQCYSMFWAVGLENDKLAVRNFWTPGSETVRLTVTNVMDNKGHGVVIHTMARGTTAETMTSADEKARDVWRRVTHKYEMALASLDLKLNDPLYGRRMG